MQDREWREDRLDWEMLPDYPMALFRLWHTEAVETEPWHAGAMLLSTATQAGMPSARVVLMRGFGEEGIRFYTHYESRKGFALAENPRFAAVFWWPSQVRQVRLEGTVVRLSRSDSESYFAGRPRGSQLGAWSSPQSQPIDGLENVRERYAAAAQAYAGREVPCPPFWGGYLLQPVRAEFWQGGQDRLHDRALYTQAGEAWNLTRLAP